MGGWRRKRRQEEINRIRITRKERARNENPLGYFIVIKMRNNEDLNLVVEGIEKRLRFE